MKALHKEVGLTQEELVKRLNEEQATYRALNLEAAMWICCFTLIGVTLVVLAPSMALGCSKSIMGEESVNVGTKQHNGAD